jgi:hypothetical protein
MKYSDEEFCHYKLFLGLSYVRSSFMVLQCHLRQEHFQENYIYFNMI